MSGIQLLEHERLGTLGYIWPRWWVFHWERVDQALIKLSGISGKVERLEVDSSGIRLLSDMDLIQKAYKATTDLVINSALCVQHFCEEVERTLKLVPVDSALEDRLAAAMQEAGVTFTMDSRGYNALHEILQCRDSVEHPKATNTYNGDPTEWDRVPLAWGLSHRSVLAAKLFVEWFESIADEWEEKRADLGRPATLEVQRGIGSERPYKKPPVD